MALLELYAVGASLAVMVGAVALVNARLLPMTITLMPLLRAPGVPAPLYYLAAHWIAVTAWAAGQRDCPLLPERERLPYFFGMAMLLWSSCLATTAIGFALADSVPAGQVSWARFVFQTLFMLPFVLRGHALRWPRHFWLQALRGFAIALTTLIFFAALRYLPLADAITLSLGKFNRIGDGRGG